MKKTKSDSSRPAARVALLGRVGALGLAVVLAPLATGAFLLTPAKAVAAIPAQRIVDGTVLDGNDKPISGAVVYLKDQKTMSVKTYLTDDGGHYRFGDLGQSVDYELWAQYQGARSKSKNISSFDSRNDFHFQLKVSK